MKIQFSSKWVVALLGLVALATAGMPASAQQKQQSPMPERAPASSPSQPQAAPINIEITGISVSPSAPRGGQPATVKLTIRNAGSGTVARVPWTIHLYTGNQQLAQGEQSNVAPGASFDVTATWTPAPGSQKLQGYVDPSGKTFKNTAPVSAQTKELNVNIPQVSASTQGAGGAPRETRVLEHYKAKLAGANFSIGGGEVTCHAWNDGGTQNEPDAPAVAVDCKEMWVGRRADFELYSNFRLKNGWRIVRAEPIDVTREGTADFSWASSLPTAGSDNPYVKIRLWANVSGRVKLRYKVTIDGPQGTDPYQ